MSLVLKPIYKFCGATIPPDLKIQTYYSQMRKLAPYLVILYLLTACKSDPICKACQTFLDKDKLFNYEKQRFSYAKYMVGSNGILISRDSSIFNNDVDKHIIEKAQLEDIRDSLFCFTGRSYADVLKYIPSTADSVTWDSINISQEDCLEIGETQFIYTSDFVLNVGLWGANFPDNDYISFIGQSNLQFRFRKESDKFVFVGDLFDHSKLERCIKREVKYL